MNGAQKASALSENPGPNNRVSMVQNRPSLDRPAKLTRRGQEVAELIALGLSNREIGKRLFLSDRTVEWHIEQVLNRLGFNSRSEIAAWVGRTQTGSAVRAPGTTRHGNLPAAITTFVGREPDIDELKVLLARNRLVTVIGPGGTGKTRLAIKVAEELEPTYSDRAWLCDLASVADGELVADAIAQALGLANETPDRLAAVRTHLSARSTLLVLDNCEHLLRAVAHVATDLLAACSGVRILATSLAPLGVLGEAVWRLQPLPPNDAVQLFVERAKASAPGFAIDATTTNSVRMICRRIDCLPLGIELAAPRLRVLSIVELADAVLESTTGSFQGRHQSLDALVNWGYQTLEDRERELFMRLGIFAGWFEHEDAAAIASSGVARLADLVEKSMVTLDRTRNGRARYRLLEILKAFARKRLSESGALTDIRLAHAEWMIRLAEEPALYSIATSSSIKIASLVDDARAAMVSLLELRPRRATRFAAALSGFWRVSGRLVEGLRWENTVLEKDVEPSFDRCWLLYSHANLLLDLGNRTDAMAAFTAANSMADLPECDPMRGHLLIWRGWVVQQLGELAAGEALYRDALDFFDSAGGNPYSTRALVALAATLLFGERLHEARDLAERAVALERGAPEVLDVAAQANVMTGEIDRARAYWLEAASRADDNQLTVVVAGCLEGLAYAAALRGKRDTALRLHHRAESLLAETEGQYAEPIARRVAECMQRLEAEVDPRDAATLRTDGEALSISEAIELAQAEG